jgi:hypothetical protein
MEDLMASTTLVDGPYAFSLLLRRTRPSFVLSREGSIMPALVASIMGECRVVPATALAPINRRNALRDGAIGFVRFRILVSFQGSLNYSRHPDAHTAGDIADRGRENRLLFR